MFNYMLDLSTVEVNLEETRTVSVQGEFSSAQLSFLSTKYGTSPCTCVLVIYPQYLTILCVDVIHSP